MASIAQMLSARLFLTPQLVGDRIFFLSNLGQGGHLSLYSMDVHGSVPDPLLPPDIALQNPKQTQGASFIVFPRLGKILVLIDHHSDENYQPMYVPIDGGVPRLAFDDRFAHFKVRCPEFDLDRNIAYLHAESTSESILEMYQADLDTGALRLLGKSQFGSFLGGVASDHRRAILIDEYGFGDTVLYEWNHLTAERQLFFGVPQETRDPANPPTTIAFGDTLYTPGDRGLLVATNRYSDTFGLGYIDFAQPDTIKEVTISGTIHQGAGEFIGVKHVNDITYTLTYNIDGCSWMYEADFNEAALTMRVTYPLCGQDAPLANGVLEAIRYDHSGNRYAAAFSTASSPCQLYTISGPTRGEVRQHTSERLLGIPGALLSPGEDASYVSFDGLRVSARLYLPSIESGQGGPYPLVYYIHGGPNGQERPDFTWFSMPLIQFLTLNDFAVFVPNVRGSTGYGMNYAKQVERDWGGKDRLDHVHAMTQVLPRDARLDLTRTAVIGRSYGGFMTLTLASRHPGLWSAAVDMFGPVDLLTWIGRIPPAWLPVIAMVVGDPEKDREMLIERSPRTYINQIACPLLVIQGKNDPRVDEQESHEVVEQLHADGKQAEYLLFADEGHDVLKYANRVTCYTRITSFFLEHLKG
jgi:pimeloyl-ACP methyl ester carboxylesterase